MSNIEFWNNRYKADEYAYGTEPNAFFKEWIDKLQPGKILLPAEGEGRNAVYSAKSGWEVIAFDNSFEAKNKAMKLANINKLIINYFCAELEDLQLEKISFDIIGLIFAHFAETKRKEFNIELTNYLKFGGYIILEGFSKRQLEYQKKFNSGGPSNIELLFSEEAIKDDFKSLKTIQLETIETELNEGIFHKGLASVVRYVGQKV